MLLRAGAELLIMIDRARFFTAVREAPFGGALTQSQVEGMTHLLDVWDASYAEKHQDERFFAYALATTFHETARTMQPIEAGRAGGVPMAIRPDPGIWSMTGAATFEHAQKRLEAELRTATIRCMRGALSMRSTRPR
jgi:hypothetical protein